MEYLGDFHVHSTYSDGILTIPQLVDFYGQQGFKALAITDHLCEDFTFLGRTAKFLNRTLRQNNFSRYIEEIYRESKRAQRLYGMTLIPGVEITKNSFSHHNSAHIVALGISKNINPNLSVKEVCQSIEAQGGIAIAAHPVSTRKIEPQTFYLWNHRDELKDYFDAWEVASGPVIFDEVQGSGLPIVASSDLHQPRQMTSWKTKLEGVINLKNILSSITHQNLGLQFFKQQNYDFMRMIQKESSLAFSPYTKVRS